MIAAGGMPIALPSAGMVIGVLLAAVAVVAAVIALASNDWNPRDAWEDSRLFVVASVSFLAGVALLALEGFTRRQRVKAQRRQQRTSNAKRLRDTKKRHKAATDERNKQVGRLNDAARRAAEDAAASTPTPDARPESDEDRQRRLDALREGMWDE